jgi:hypothetical protein
LDCAATLRAFFPTELLKKTILSAHAGSTQFGSLLVATIASHFRTPSFQNAKSKKQQ